MPEVDDLIKELGNSKSEKRTSAAKKLRKRGYSEAGSEILEALKKEVMDVRTWKTQFELILALGELQCGQALPFLWELTDFQTPHTIVYTALGDAIVRAAPKSQQVEAIFRLIDTKNHSLIHGAFHAMSVLRLKPSEDQIDLILAAAEDPQAAVEVKNHPNDRTGNRLWVAIAAAGWPPERVQPFLQECLTFPDQGLQLAANDALKGKHTKWASW